MSTLLSSRRAAHVCWSLPLLALSCDDAEPGLSCEGLGAQLALSSGVSVSAASEVRAGSEGAVSFPEHCLVTGEIDPREGVGGRRYAIGFELRMPLAGYQGSLFFQGGGGTDGVINPAYGDLINHPQTNALSLGHAVVSTDGGHGGGAMDVSFGLDPQARIDYGYNAVGRVTGAAKEIVAAFYGRAPSRSYFVGCSNGGRQGMVAATRFASEFDGILAVNPGMRLPEAALAQAWDTRQLMAAASPGQLPRDAFPAAVTSLVAERIVARCDVLDGLEDGIVHATAACQEAFQLSADVPTCAEGEEAGCLSAAQKEALAEVFGGARDSAGAELYAGFPWDPGIAGSGWRFWKLDAGFAPLPLNTLVGAAALGYVFTTPPDAPDLGDGGLAYQLAFDFDSGAAKINATSGSFTEAATQFMAPPEATRLTAWKARGGKLIVVHGTGDPVFSSDDSVRWYTELLAGDPEAPGYAQLFLVPQMNHCGGGPATDRFDMFSALRAWVEDDAAPGPVEASVDPANPDVARLGWPGTRTRLLCPHPGRAVASPDAADTESSVAFACD